ncbi:YitT family protein [Planococcus glaciei]|uniref:YitT family protein n=1 Tax=Planococcus glaciei TaxID=459472 RepID=A0A7H8QGA9_9BACL|nr:YitT family protein [Planococcus glaciei]MBX0313505.1 YitT family protein [Planococcus glaciei]QDY46792.1 YitT family protein [Planococcus glaciei]QKX52561.1 YitT family protein [Planococcus glaciei]
MNKRKQRNRQEPHPYLNLVADYISILIGSAIVAIAFNVFLLPNEVASGGVSGISTILKGLFGWTPAFVQWAFNIPLFIAGIILLGKNFGIKTAVGTIFLPFVVYLTANWEPWTLNPLLGAIFGGIGVGTGIGIVFRGQASTGGTDLAAQIITKYTGFTLGTSVALIDGMIVLAAAIVFDIEKGLYALIGLYLTTKTIDLVQVGFGRSKLVYIITNKQVEMRDAIYEEIDRGVTKLTATGGYTETEKPIIMVVVHQTEFTRLKQLVKTVDSSAFVIVSDAAEVLGEGFKRA